MDRKIPIIFCIDAEPDPRFIERNSPAVWQGYEAAHLYMRELRRELEIKTGSRANYSWFFRVDPQIAEGYGRADWALHYYKEWIRGYEAQGDEVGLHPHAYRWDNGKWIADHGNQVWIEYCLGTAFEGFQKNFGRLCRSFRFGDRFMNQETMDYLESAGVRYDLTLEPGYKKQNSMIASETATGNLPETLNMPHFPYHPNSFDYQTQDPARRDGILIIPVSTGVVRPKAGRREWLWKKLFRPEELRARNVTLNLSFGPNGFCRVVDSILKNETAHLVLVMRTDAAVKEDFRRNVEANIKQLLNHPLRERFIFCTPEQALCELGREPAKYRIEGRAYAQV